MTADGLGVAAQAAGGGDLLAPVEAEVERTVADELPRVRCRGGCRPRSRCSPTTRCGVTPSAFSVSAMRVGPSRLISTAEVERESKPTAAAEWMTMSQVANVRAVGLVEAEPVGADIAADRRRRGGRSSASKVSCGAAASSALQPVEGVVLEDLAAHPFGGVVALAGPDQQHQLASRCRCAAVARRARCRRSRCCPVMAMRFLASCSADHAGASLAHSSTIW